MDEAAAKRGGADEATPLIEVDAPVTPVSSSRRFSREPMVDRPDAGPPERTPAFDLVFERRVNRLLVEALELPATQRRDHVIEQADGDGELVAEVLALLADQDGLGSFLETPAVVDLRYLEEGPPSEDGGDGEDGALPPVPASLGPYTIVERLGAGGMGEVFRARQEEPVRREVALKRLRVFLQVCSGVEHAHRHQILHRDLKPSNVLVVEERGRPVPKVIDFGIAKSLDRSGDPDRAGLTLETLHGLLGTPAYMSPGALGPGSDSSTDAEAVDTRADVYSLGVILFELLTGRTPFDRGESHLAALLERVEAGAADRPSRCLRRLDEEESGTVAARRGTTRSELLRTVGGDLDWIVSEAIAIQERALEPGNPDLADPLVSRGRLYRARGDLATAERLARRALAIREKAYPHDHHWVREARDQLDQILAEERSAKS